MSINFNNLSKLANFLEANVTNEQFSMDHFRAGGNGETIPGTKEHCGTIGCALGWGPWVKGLEVKAIDLHNLAEAVSWSRYSSRVLGVSFSDNEWDFMFSGSWVHVDNTVEGAIARIKYIIRHKGLEESLTFMDLIIVMKKAQKLVSLTIL